MNEIFDTNCIIISTPSNLFYFTDYKSADAVLVFFDHKSYYFTDSRYFEEVGQLLTGFIVLDICDLGTFFRDNHIADANIEGDISLNFYKTLQSFGIVNFTIFDGHIAAMRAIKKPYELVRIKKAQAITDATFSDIFDYIKEDITERELASCLESLLLQNGADELAFTSIVAFGENTSKPHAHRSDKKLQKNMPITLDFGAKYNGYCSDMTRTIFFGTPNTDFINIYKAVLDAQVFALNNIKIGLSGKDCDNFAREYLKKLDLDKYFVHSLGHSLGIDIHEVPNFSKKCDTIMEKGMVLSVEPGVYIPNKYGVRIEDIIYFDETCIKNLTKSPKKMIIL